MNPSFTLFSSNEFSKYWFTKKLYTLELDKTTATELQLNQSIDFASLANTNSQYVALSFQESVLASNRMDYPASSSEIHRFDLANYQITPSSLAILLASGLALTRFESLEFLLEFCVRIVELSAIGADFFSSTF